MSHLTVCVCACVLCTKMLLLHKAENHENDRWKLGEQGERELTWTKDEEDRGQRWRDDNYGERLREMVEEKKQDKRQSEKNEGILSAPLGPFNLCEKRKSHFKSLCHEVGEEEATRHNAGEVYEEKERSNSLLMSSNCNVDKPLRRRLTFPLQ